MASIESAEETCVERDKASQCTEMMYRKQALSVTVQRDAVQKWAQGSSYVDMCGRSKRAVRIAHRRRWVRLVYRKTSGSASTIAIDIPSRLVHLIATH